MTPRGDARSRFDRATLAVAALAVVGLVARLAGLGARAFHWDEARVGYWTLRYLDTGAFEYRPVAGGTFLPLVNRHVFALFGANDFTARLVVALAGGLLPLVALLYRSRLRDDETVAFALVLAVEPVLLYYSRFARGELLLTAFSLLAVGCFLRAVDADSRRSLYAGVAAVGLLLSTSGFAVVTLLCWALAAVLTFDHLRVRGDSNPVAAAGRIRRGLVSRATPLARSTFLLLGVVFVFYAPRAGDADDVGLWNLTTLPATVESAFLGSFRKFWAVRVDYRRTNGHELLPYVLDYAELLVTASLPVLGLAVGAFFYDRYLTGGRRPLLQFFGFWAGVSLLLVPMLAEQFAPWLAVHTVAALTLPAALGVAALARMGRVGLERDRAARVGVVALVSLVLLAHVGGVVAANVYGQPGPDDDLAQYAQPSQPLEPMLENASAAMERTDGPDVVYVGEAFYTLNADSDRRPPVSDAWGNRLPLPWYFERLDARQTSVADPNGLTMVAGEPAVVVADGETRSQVARRLEGYESTRYELGLWNREVFVFVKQ
ncbi:flippase activity-associated protein Agl23 [Haloprofundus sp. MHR1]|uniref:flippase activity-associated protein Agl23 n=1 Tax=Haloprofundus sp. MHR1 TaxID=2572921 RepID=UPI0010BF3D35|nr:flippase activity-associated protein Agl23 [Haloprofundus sp. MHR1]QCJ48071.1 TIGR03663 family protein [Haloprofundus sp. MHR1]